VRVLIWLFYRRIEVIGAEHIPREGSLVVVANHHNAVVDAMLVMATLPRPVMVLAKAPLFRHPLIGPFLKLMGAVPVSRRQEGGDDPTRNEAMFAAAIKAVHDGGALLIFPEGRSEPEPTLLPLRTGAARIVLGAESVLRGRGHVVLLPVGLVFHDPGSFRAASVQVMIGRPVATDDCAARYATQPEASVRTLTDRLAAAIRAQIVEAEDHHTLALLRVLERAWQEESARLGEPAAVGPDGARASLAWRQQVMRAARYLEAREPGRIAELRHRIEAHAAHLDEVGLTSRQLGQPYTARTVARYVAENALVLVIGLPLAAWGSVTHGVPYRLTGVAVRWLDRTIEEEATYKIVAGVVLYPVCWMLEGWLGWRLFGGWGLALFVILLVPSGLLALAWRDRLDRVRRQARGFARFLGDRGLHQWLLDERRALVDDLSELARLVPESVRAGAAEDGR
jgi:1-acyl-sn-glycerol-3-phosphate acyltransferase